MVAVKHKFFKIKSVSRKTEKKNKGFFISTIPRTKALSNFSNAVSLLLSRSARIIIMNAVNISIKAINIEAPKKMNQRIVSLVFNKLKIFLLPFSNEVELTPLGSFELTLLIDIS